MSVFPNTVFALSGIESSALVAAETINPRKAFPKAVNSIWIRLCLFYILGSIIVTITVSPKAEDLFGGSGTNASPFVIAFKYVRSQWISRVSNPTGMAASPDWPTL